MSYAWCHGMGIFLFVLFSVFLVVSILFFIYIFKLKNTCIYLFPCVIHDEISGKYHFPHFVTARGEYVAKRGLKRSCEDVEHIYVSEDGLFYEEGMMSEYVHDGLLYLFISVLCFTGSLLFIKAPYLVDYLLSALLTSIPLVFVLFVKGNSIRKGEDTGTVAHILLHITMCGIVMLLFGMLVELFEIYDFAILYYNAENALGMNVMYGMIFGVFDAVCVYFLSGTLFRFVLPTAFYSALLYVFGRISIEETARFLFVSAICVFVVYMLRKKAVD